MMRLFLFLVMIGIGSTSVRAEDCVTFSGLAPAFTSELGLDAQKVKIQFTPLNLGLKSAEVERAAYLLSNLSDCSISGDCDSVIYLRGDTETGRKCYRSVLTFRGKWKGLDRTKASTLASLEVESRFEVPRIERRMRHFKFDSKTGNYQETK